MREPKQLENGALAKVELPASKPVIYGSHLTVIDTIYYQRTSGQPFASESKFYCPLKNEGQPYVREIVIGDVWEPLDCGWVKGPSMLKISNGKEIFFLQPSREQIAAASSKVLEVATQDTARPLLEIPPGESLRGRFLDPKSLVLRCRNGTCHCTISLFSL